MTKTNRMLLYIHIIMIVLFFLLSSYVILFNEQNRLPISLWAGLSLTLAIIRHRYIQGNNRRLVEVLFPYLELGILLFIVSIDITGTSLAITAIISMDIIVDYKYTYSVPFSIIVYLAYMSKYFSYGDIPLVSKILIFAIGAFQFCLYNGIALLTKKYSIQSEELEQTTAELNAKMISLEQMTVLKERNRIAGEIHNTLGHQLTTALIQVEATQMLLDKDREEAQRRLTIIKDQIREGLKEIRKSIHAINAEQEYEDLAGAVGKLIGQVKSHAGVEVELNMEAVESLRLPLKKLIYHIVLEAITNAIRHGRCSRIKINIARDGDLLSIQSFNNGSIPEDIKYGYGLGQLKETLKELGGSFIMKINEENWFGIMIKLPIYRDGESHG